MRNVKASDAYRLGLALGNASSLLQDIDPGFPYLSDFMEMNEDIYKALRQKEEESNGNSESSSA